MKFLKLRAPLKTSFFVCHSRPPRAEESLKNTGSPTKAFGDDKLNRRFLEVLLISVFILIFAFSPAFAAAGIQTLMKGQSTTVNFDYEMGDVAVADPQVADYLVAQDRRALYVNAKAGGETVVTVWDKNGAKRDELRIRVVTTTLKEVLDKAKTDFGELSGVKLNVRGGHVEVAGEVAEPEDYKRIETATKQDLRLRNRVKLSGGVISQVVSAIAENINAPGVTVRAVQGKVVLEGVAYSTADAKRAVEIAKLYSPDVMDLIDVKDTKRQVGRGKMIELTFHMMEIKKQALRGMGISWAPGATQGGGGGNAGMGSGSGLFSGIGDLAKSVMGFVMQFVPKLRTISERGDGRVLENPSVIVKSGEEAKIFSGSEIPYYKGQDVDFKKVGIQIEAVPVEVGDGVDIKLSATLSSPTADIRGSIDTHTISTSAIVKLGQSLVIGNIIRNGDVKMKNRVPAGLDTSSALFTLFLSKDFQSNRSEFVIFVTPKIVEMPGQAEANLNEFLAMEEAMIRDRSKREHAMFMSEKLNNAESKEKAAPKRRRKFR